VDNDDFLPPNNIEAEQAILGALLSTPELYANASASLLPEDFYRVSHSIIWQSIDALHKDGIPADSVTLSSYLKDRDQLEQVGGRMYLVDLGINWGGAANVLAYVKELKKLTRARKALRLVHQLQRDLVQKTSQVDLVISDAREAFEGLAAQDLEAKPLAAQMSLDVFDDIEFRCQHPGKMFGIPSGFLPLDKIIPGYVAGRLTVVGGRSGMGKTTFMVDSIKHILTHYQLPVAMFSLEMSGPEITEKLLCNLAMVDQEHSQRGLLETNDWCRIANAMETLSTAAPFYVYDLSHKVNTVDGIRARLSALKAEGNLPALAVVDHLQIMATETEERNRVVQLGQITQGLKKLAVDFDIAVVALCQLSRGLLTRANKQPNMGDLRESGDIEQNSDLVFFVHRPEMLEDKPEQSERRGDVEMIVGKNRFGKTGLAPLKFRGSTGTFHHFDRDMAEYLRKPQDIKTLSPVKATKQISQVIHFDPFSIYESTALGDIYDG